MDDHVDIMPQITDPDMMRRPVTTVLKADSAGIFTSLYDNKIIALCIVIAIIIIAVCAYVFFKRDTAPMTVHSPTAPTAPDPPSTNGAPGEPAPTSATANGPADATDTNRTQVPTPGTKVSKTDLQQARQKLDSLMKPPEEPATNNDFNDVLEDKAPTVE